LHSARLAQPVGGWFVLSVTFGEWGAAEMRAMLRGKMMAYFGAVGQRAALPLTNLEDGKWLIRFVSRRAPAVVNSEGLELIVQPAAGSVLRVDAELRQMRSHVGVIPIMTRITVVQFMPQKRGMLG
jgi:hypothetical protein